MSRRIKCPKCKGSGKVFDKFFAAMTFGVSVLLDDKDTCPRCNGKGYIVVNYNYDR